MERRKLVLVARIEEREAKKIVLEVKRVESDRD